MHRVLYTVANSKAMLGAMPGTDFVDEPSDTEEDPNGSGYCMRYSDRTPGSDDRASLCTEKEKAKVTAYERIEKAGTILDRPCFFVGNYIIKHHR